MRFSSLPSDVVEAFHRTAQLAHSGFPIDVRQVNRALSSVSVASHPLLEGFRRVCDTAPAARLLPPLFARANIRFTKNDQATWLSHELSFFILQSLCEMHRGEVNQFIPDDLVSLVSSCCGELDIEIQKSPASISIVTWSDIESGLNETLPYSFNDDTTDEGTGWMDQLASQGIVNSEGYIIPTSTPEGALSTLPRYKLTKCISSSMGSVYFAEEVTLNMSGAPRRVVVKINPKYEGGNELMSAEWGTHISFTHSHRVVTPLSTFWSQGRQVIVLERIDGDNLDYHENSLKMLSRIEATHDLSKWCGESMLWRIMKQTTAALAIVHQEGLIHGDIKDLNFLLDRHSVSQGGFTVKLLDFGVTRKVGDGLKGNGTVSFMAPEVLAFPDIFTGKKVAAQNIQKYLTGRADELAACVDFETRFANQPITQASDIYSLGVTFANFILKKHLFSPTFQEGESRGQFQSLYKTMLARMAILSNGERWLASFLAADLPKEVWQLLKACIDESIDKRPQNGANLLFEMICMLPNKFEQMAQSTPHSQLDYLEKALESCLSLEAEITEYADIKGLKERWKRKIVDLASRIGRLALASGDTALYEKMRVLIDRYESVVVGVVSAPSRLPSVIQVTLSHPHVPANARMEVYAYRRDEQGRIRIEYQRAQDQLFSQPFQFPTDALGASVYIKGQDGRLLFHPQTVFPTMSLDEDGRCHLPLELVPVIGEGFLHIPSGEVVFDLDEAEQSLVEVKGFAVRAQPTNQEYLSYLERRAVFKIPSVDIANECPSHWPKELVDRLKRAQRDIIQTIHYQDPHYHVLDFEWQEYNDSKGQRLSSSDLVRGLSPVHFEQYAKNVYGKKAGLLTRAQLARLSRVGLRLFPWGNDHYPLKGATAMKLAIKEGRIHFPMGQSRADRFPSRLVKDQFDLSLFSLMGPGGVFTAVQGMVSGARTFCHDPFPSIPRPGFLQLSAGYYVTGSSIHDPMPRSPDFYGSKINKDQSVLDASAFIRVSL